MNAPTQPVCLALNVRDCEDVVGRAIQSALPYVDRYVIIDTGSEDGTIAAVRRAVGDLPGELLAAEWKGHAHNRTYLLAAARQSGADYTLMLDADMELIMTGGWPRLFAPSVMIPIHDRGLIYPLPLLTSTRFDFYYHGVAHSYLTCKDPAADVTEHFTAGYLQDHGGGGGRPGKIEADMHALRAAVAEDPNDRRSWYYLAQSYRDLEMVEEAIGAYKYRASLGGWDEEVYNALYQAGKLLCNHVSFAQGADLLLQAYKLMPHRAEALRQLGGIADAVADKLPFPATDVLFVEPAAYKQPVIQPVEVQAPAETFQVARPVPVLDPGERRKPRVTKVKGLNVKDVAAIVVTRGNVDLADIVASLPYGEVLVWDNSKRFDFKIFGRYAAVPFTQAPVVYWQDDDVILTAAQHAALLREYEPGVLVSNMDADWRDGAGYRDAGLAMVGAGSLCPPGLPAEIFPRYLDVHPEINDDFLLNCDFAFGILAPSKIVDVGYGTMPWTDNADRLYQQPGQTVAKWSMIERAQRIRDAA